MMKRHVLLISAAFVVLLTLAAVLDVTHSETPNDPRVNPDANACYTGGSMAGKCKMDGELWIAGWYEIRLEYGLITKKQIPDAYKWLIPPESNNPTDVPRSVSTAPTPAPTDISQPTMVPTSTLQPPPPATGTLPPPIATSTSSAGPTSSFGPTATTTITPGN